MIEGGVNADLEAVIPLHIRGEGGRALRIEAVIDTGFSAQLSLPMDRIDQLGLSWRKRTSATLADGRAAQVEVYGAEVMWAGRSRTVEVIATNVQPLVGMALLEGYSLSISVVENGTVRISELNGHATGA